jgi:hypothetical protein
VTHETLFETDKPFLDAKGRARLDIKLDYARRVVRVSVKIRNTSSTFQWKLFQDYTLENAVFKTRAERRQVLTAFADMAAIRLGHEYRLRSKL